MPYVLDANTLITAKNDYYAFQLCPGFWQWLEQEAGTGEVLSIDRIRVELERGNDDLATWATNHRAFFRPDDPASLAAMTPVTAWVQAHNFTPAAKREFFGCADPYLIAYALAHHHTVVSHEVHVPGQKNRVKIPTVCLALNVVCERTFPWLVRRGAVFVLGNPAQARTPVPARTPTQTTPQAPVPAPAPARAAVSGAVTGPVRPLQPPQTVGQGVQQKLLPDDST